IAQALILYFVIYESVCMFTKTNAFLLSSIIVCTLSFTTGLSNYTSQIMPDIFTSICFIGFGMILTSEKMRWKEIILIVLVVFAIMTSFSNLLVMIGLFMISVIFLFLRITSIKLVTKAFVVILIPLIIILSVNKSYTGKYQISKSSNVSILGRMIETGVVKKYLTKNCNTHSYSLCDQINNIPGSCSQFLWDENSPLYDTACLHKSWNYCWEVKNKEYGRLIKDIITTPDYLKQLTVIYIKDF